MEQGHRVSIDEAEDTFGFAVFYRNVLIAQATARLAERFLRTARFE